MTKRLLSLLLRVANIAKWLTLVAVVVCLCLYLILISPIGQRLIGNVLAHAASGAGTGQCTIRNVHLWGFPVIRADGVVWTSKSDTVLSCDTVTVQVIVLPLLRRHINVPFVRISNLHVNIRQDSTHWNIADLFTKPRPNAPTPYKTAQPSKKPIRRIAVGSLSIPNAKVTIASLTPELNLHNDTMTVLAENFVYLPDRLSLQKFRFELPQLAFTLNQAKLNLTKSPPHGSVTGDITIPDSTIRRFLASWKASAPVAVDFVASNSPYGINTRLGVFLPGQSANIQLQNIDAKLRIISVDGTVENLNLATFVPSIDSSNLTAEVKATVTNIATDLGAKGTLLLKNSYLKPLSKLSADVAFGYDKHTSTVKGKVGEYHGDMTVDISTKELTKTNASAKLTASGKLRHLRDYLPGTDYPDSIQFSAAATSTGQKIPIDTVRFNAGMSKHTWFQNVLDSIFVQGVYVKNKLTIDTVHTISGQARIDGGGVVNFNGEYEFHGSARNLVLAHIPQLYQADSTLAGTANVAFRINSDGRSKKDTSKSAISGAVSGTLTKFEFNGGTADSIIIKTAEFHYPDSPYRFNILVDSVRTKFVSPVSLSVVGEWKNDSIRASIHANADTISTILAFHGFLHPNTMSGTAIPETLIVKNPKFPLYSLNPSPVVLERGKVQWNNYQFDTPFGVLNGSVKLDTIGNVSGSNSIERMALPSMVTLIPTLRNLQGDISVTADWTKKKSQKLHVDATVLTTGLGWNKLDLLDSLTTSVNYRGDRLIWDMKGRREGREALTSYGSARLNDSAITGFDSLYLTTIQMPSSWFSGMLPARSVWDGTAQLRVEHDEQYGMKMRVDLTGKRLLLPDYGIDQHDIVVHAATVGNSLVIQEGQTKSGNGKMQLTGRVTFRNYLPDSLDLLAVANSFRFMKQSLKTFTGDMDMRITGTINHMQLNGSTSLSEVRYDVGEQDKDLEPITLEDDDVSVFPAMTVWDNSSGTIDVSAPGNVWVRGLGINAEARMSLSMEKEEGVRVPKIYGTIEVIRGTVTQYSTKLTISEGIMNFDGPADDPTLQITATTDQFKKDSVNISLTIGGTAQKPDIVLSGEKNGQAMEVVDIISYLTFGKPLQGGSYNLTDQAKGLVLNQLSNYLGQAAGPISLIQYKQAVNNTAARTAADSLEVGGYITDKLFFSIVSPVDASAVNSKNVRVEYQLLPWLRIAAGNDALNNQSLEAFIQTEWGKPKVKKDTVKVNSDTAKVKIDTAKVAK